eukprot:7269568-Pyramimonas_sp.AAC.1
MAGAAPRRSRIGSALSEALRAPVAASSPSSRGPKISMSKAWPSSVRMMRPAERRRPTRNRNMAAVGPARRK